MSFIIFLCVTRKLFSFVFVPLLAQNPVDATVGYEQSKRLIKTHLFGRWDRGAL